MFVSSVSFFRVSQSQRNGGSKKSEMLQIASFQIYLIIFLSLLLSFACPPLSTLSTTLLYASAFFSLYFTMSLHFVPTYKTHDPRLGPRRSHFSSIPPLSVGSSSQGASKTRRWSSKGQYQLNVKISEIVKTRILLGLSIKTAALSLNSSLVATQPKEQKRKKRSQRPNAC